MAKTNINLNMTSVENREYRLGTIIGWDGKASEQGRGLQTLRIEFSSEPRDNVL